MEMMIACCGLECSQCSAFIAARDNNDELRKTTARKWLEQFHAEFDLESIDCSGCRAEGVHGPYCSMCEIRVYVVKKGMSTFIHRSDYGCEKPAKVNDMDKECKARLDAIRRGL